MASKRSVRHSVALYEVYKKVGSALYQEWHSVCSCGWRHVHNHRDFWIGVFQTEERHIKKFSKK